MRTETERKVSCENDPVLFFYDGWQCVEEYTAAGARTKRYVYGEGIDEVVKATVPDVNDVDSDMDTSEDLDLYYHQNSLGSVAAVTDLNGTVVEEYSYTAYGELTVDTKVGTTTGTGTATRVAQPFGFTGRRHDYEEASGLLFYSAPARAPSRAGHAPRRRRRQRACGAAVPGPQRPRRDPGVSRGPAS